MRGAGDPPPNAVSRGDVMRVRLRNVGKAGWRSWDVDGSELSATPGQVVEMSEERAIRLMADYVGSWEMVEVPEPPSPKHGPPPDVLEMQDVVSEPQPAPPPRRRRR